MFKDRLQDSLQNLTKYGDKVGRTRRPPVRRLGRLQEGARQRRQLRHPGDAAGLPPDAPARRGRGRQEHLHREAGGRGSGRASRCASRRRRWPSRRASAIVAGTQRRHHAGVPRDDEAHPGRRHRRRRRVRVYWNQGGLWTKPRQAEWTDMEWQLRNWLYFTWLSGDHIVEQHVHNLDVANWVMGGKPPVRVVGVGGRQARTAPEYGHIYDHFGLDYEYANGARAQHVPPAAGHARPRRRVRRRHQGHVRHAGRRPLRDQGAERVEVDGRVHEPVRAGAHGPHREHPRRQPAERAAAGGREHADGDRRTRGGLHGQGGRARCSC